MFKGPCPLGIPYQACKPFGQWSHGKEKEELKSDLREICLHIRSLDILESGYFQSSWCDKETRQRYD